MIFTILPISAYDFEVDGIYYKIISAEDKTCMLTAGDIKYSGQINIPSTVIYKGKNLLETNIDEEAFSDCEELTGVTIPNSINEIGKYAFSLCELLSYISIPESIIEIKDGTFCASGIQKIDLPNTICQISELAFAYCKNLQDISLPLELIKIESKVFKDCNNLKNIDIPNSIRSIGQYAFQNCTSIEKFITPNTVQGIGSYAFDNCSNLISIDLPESLTYIGDYAFSNCINLDNIIMPNSINKLGKYAFYKCSSLNNIQLSKSLTEIDFGTFEDCVSIQSMSIPSQITKIENGSFRNCESMHTLIFENGPESLMLNYLKSGKTIYSVFEKCNSLTNLVIGRQVYVRDNQSNFNSYYSGLNNITSLKLLPNAYFDKIYYGTPSYKLSDLLRSNILPSINCLTIDKDLDCVGLDLSPYKKIESVIVESSTPLTCPQFTTDQYLNYNIICS